MGACRVSWWSALLEIGGGEEDDSARCVRLQILTNFGCSVRLVSR